MQAVLENSSIAKFNLPGLVHQTLCGRSNGVNSFEIWMQTVSPQAATPVHKHDCDEAIVVLKGSGRLIIEGEIEDFSANSTLIIPPNIVHQIINTGDEELFLIATLSVPNVEVLTADNNAIALPWQHDK